MSIDRLKDAMDHGSLTGLGDDDHPQYMLKAPLATDFAAVTAAPTSYPLGLSIFTVSGASTWPGAADGVVVTMKHGDGLAEQPPR